MTSNLWEGGCLSLLPLPKYIPVQVGNSLLPEVLLVSLVLCMPPFASYLHADGLDLYPINPLNAPIYPEDRKYMCGHWLVEYEKIHNGEPIGSRYTFCLKQGLILYAVHNLLL